MRTCNWKSGVLEVTEVRVKKKHLQSFRKGGDSYGAVSVFCVIIR